MTWYDRHSIRLKGYDYSREGLYFCTLCTHKRGHLFGEIKNGMMDLNNYGIIVRTVWKSLPQHHDVVLNEFQIMPNHVHFIIQIDYSMGRENRAPTLGQIIAYFKYQSTKQINDTVGAGSSRPGSSHPDVFPKIWQRNFYERIIRDEQEYDNIRYYIKHNPQNWERDDYCMDDS